MATKTQLKKKVKDLMVEFDIMISKVEELKDLFEEESSNIEPYGDSCDLTEAQEEKQEWLDDSASTLEEIINSLDSNKDDLDSIL